MNNDLNIVRAGQLQSVASAAKDFFAQAVAAEFEDLDAFTGATSVAGGASGLVPAPAAGDNKNFLRGDGTWSSVANGSALSTVPATVDGGMWYELENSAPIVKFFHGSQTFTLNLDPNLTVTPAGVLVPINGTLTAAVSYAGSGAVSVSSDNSQITPAYSNGVISVPYVEGAGSANITVAVAASQGCSAASKTFSVTMAQDPQFSAALSYNSNYAYKSSEGIYYMTSSLRFDLSYLGDGALGYSSTDSTYGKTIGNKVIFVNASAVTENPATVTFTLTESPPYSADSISYRVQKVAKYPCELIVTPSATISSGDAITATVQHAYDCPWHVLTSSVISVTSDNPNIVPTYSGNNYTGNITIPYYSGGGSATITVTANCSNSETATTSFTVTMISPDPNLTLSPTSQTIGSGQVASVNVSYDGDGTFTHSARSEDETILVTYHAAERLIPVPFIVPSNAISRTVTVTGNLTACAPYDADTASCTIYMTRAEVSGDDDTPTYGLEIYDDPEETTVLSGGNGSYTLSLAGPIILKITGAEGHAVSLLDGDENDITADLRFDDTEYIFNAEPGSIPPIVTITVDGEPAISLTVEEV